ncbi:hypothetical protein [Solibacillus sp. FSL K6-1523]|uniref:hypothetical protein n=1 Tax=Solibacillus sp. FSL K6-1523 TaxID=2921471 RepID=UPI0030FCA2AA
MQISIILVVLFSVFAVVKMLNHRKQLKELPKNEVIFGFITYVGIYSVSLGLIAQLYDWLLVLELNKYFKWGLSIIIIIAAIVTISRILNKLLSEKLKKIFM